MKSRGHTVPLSPQRIWVGDFLHFAQRIPTVPVVKTINCAALVAARSELAKPVRWLSIFLKAYAITAAERPVLRRAYLSCPWARLWEHADNVASVAISRTYNDEPAVFFAKLRSPEKLTLRELDAWLTTHSTDPIESIGAYRRLIRMTRVPRLLRRFLWSVGLNWNGHWREKNFGTFGVSVYSSTGADSQHPLTPLTTLFNYGPIHPDGTVTIRIIYDHRVMDGQEIAKALDLIEETLQTTILQELRTQNASLKKPTSPQTEDTT
jgi:hypothetical protein